MDKNDRHLRIFTDGKATFGYQLNVGNTVLGALYEYYIYANKIYRPMGDAARILTASGAAPIRQSSWRQYAPKGVRPRSAR